MSSSGKLTAPPPTLGKIYGEVTVFVACKKKTYHIFCS